MTLHYSTIFLPLLALCLTNCKPTPRTAGKAQQQDSTVQTESNTPPAVQKEEATPEDSLLTVNATIQEYNILRPWEKTASKTISARGVYLGDGRVLTTSPGFWNATYVELSLPDQSRTATARLLRYDEDLHLALLTIEHEKDANLLAALRPLQPGIPLRLGDQAECWDMVGGLNPVKIPVSVRGAQNGSIPLLAIQATQAAPGEEAGLPVVRQGQLAALTTSYDNESQTFLAVNAEMIKRFLASPAHGSAGRSDVPSLGISCVPIQDPVFQRYLQLPDGVGGLYVSRVEPAGAAAAAGLLKGDVITAIEGLELDTLGRGKHPLYGMLPGASLIRCLKPTGEQLNLTLSRQGQKQQVTVALNRDALEKSLLRTQSSSERPAYILWGGMLFQPLTKNYINALRAASSNNLPLSFLQVLDEQENAPDTEKEELVALTQIIPTAATLSYENLQFSVVEQINGHTVRNLADVARLLDEPTPDGLVSLRINQAPYTIVVERAQAEQVNDQLRRRSIPHLRVLPERSSATVNPAL